MKTESEEKKKKFKFSGDAKADYAEWLSSGKEYKVGVELIKRYGNNAVLVNFFDSNLETPVLQSKLVYNLHIISRAWTK